MASLLAKVISSIGYWSNLGLTLDEAGSRAVITHGESARSLLPQAISLFAHGRESGGMVNLSPSGLPIAKETLPCIPGAKTGLTYKVLVPVLDPETQKYEQIPVIVTSAIELGTQDIKDRARSSAAATMKLSPERFVTASGGRLVSPFGATGEPFVWWASWC